MANSDSVRKYYERNKDIVIFRKVMKRMRDSCTVPTYETIIKHQIPLQALLVAFADFAGNHGCTKYILKPRLGFGIWQFQKLAQ